MYSLLLVAALAENPQPSPAPLKTIINIHSRAMCTVLREKLAPAVGGVLANDNLAGEGQVVLNRLSADASNENADDLGADGASSSMDNLRIENVVSGLVANIEKIDAALDDASYRGKDDSDAAAIDSARARLKDVLDKQKAELNVLSYVTYSNQGTSLWHAHSLIPLANATSPPSMERDPLPVALPERLRALRGMERRAEDDATQALAPIIAACR